MKLMLVHPWAGLPSRQALYLGLQEFGWEVLVITASSWLDDYGRTVLPATHPDFKGSLVAIPVGLSGNIPLHFFKRRLKPHIKSFKPDCIYIYHEPYAVATFQLLEVAKRVSDAPVGVRSSQNVVKRYPLPFRYMERRVYAKSDFAVVVSSNVESVMRSKGYKKPISVIPMPVDTALFAPARTKRSNAKLHIGFVGRLVPEKGIDTALQAVAKLPRGSVMLTVVGSGPYEEELKRLSVSLGIEREVDWLGVVVQAAMPTVYTEFDVLLVLSKATRSWREQFGRVVVEAAACGVPVIATESGELPYLVRSLGAGWLVEEEDARAVAEILRDISDDRASGADVGDRARRGVAKQYSDASIVGQLNTTFVEALRRSAL